MTGSYTCVSACVPPCAFLHVWASTCGPTSAVGLLHIAFNFQSCFVRMHASPLLRIKCDAPQLRVRVWWKSSNDRALNTSGAIIGQYWPFYGYRPLFCGHEWDLHCRIKYLHSYFCLSVKLSASTWYNISSRLTLTWISPFRTIFDREWKGMNTSCFGGSISQDAMFSVFSFTPNEIDLKQNYSAKIRFHHCEVVLAVTGDISQIFGRS